MAIFSALAATLLAACGLAIYVYFSSLPHSEIPDPTSPPPVATLIQNTGKLTTPHDYPAEGDDYSAGEYTLASGSAEFMLTNAVNVKLRGETRMVMRNDMNVALTRGSAEFVCPTGSEGFNVHLPDGTRIVDLGTAFRVSIEESGATSIAVVDGSVRVEHPNPSIADAVLAAGDRASIAGDEVIIQSVNPMLGSRSLELAMDLGHPDDPSHLILNRHDYELRLDGATVGQGRSANEPALVFAGPPALHRASLMPGKSSIDFGKGFTVAFWVRVDSFTEQYQSLVFADDRAWRIMRHEETDKIHFATSARIKTEDRPVTRLLVSKTEVGDGAWHWVVLTYELKGKNATKNLYVDGQLEAEDTQCPPILDTTRTILLGAHARRPRSDIAFHGAIGSMTILSKPIDRDVVLEYYKQQVRPNQTPQKEPQK